jgi:hypothetical protein
LRQRLSYFECDLVVSTWNASFVYDTECGGHAAVEILEFVNSQLVEFRYYDELLDRRARADLCRPAASGLVQRWFGRRYTRSARRSTRCLSTSTSSPTDRRTRSSSLATCTPPACLRLPGHRLGLDHWKANVRDKLKTLDAIYRFAVEQTAMARGETLEFRSC